MKKVIVIILTALALVFVSCDTDDSNTNGTRIDNPDKEKPGDGITDNPDKEKPDDGITDNPEQEKPDDNAIVYARELWGEWLRMDTGDKWYISNNALKVNEMDSPMSATLTKQSDRVIEVTDGGRKYYLYASRVATASFTGAIVGDVGAGSARAVGAGLGGVRVAIANLNNKANELTANTNTDGKFTANNVIPGDAYQVTPEGGTPVTVIPTSDGDDIGVVTITSRVNFKTSLIPAQSSTDMTELYINETYEVEIEFENTGDEDCPAPSYIITTPSDITITGNLQGILGMIEPGVKKNVPIGVRCSAIASDYKYKKINVTIRDGTGKTWEDSVSLRFYRETMDFNIKAEKPVSGIVIAPDSKTYSFTNVTNGTVAAPRRASGDYLVVFSGATIETETRYSLGIGIEADGDFGTFIDTARYEPNNTEGAAVSLDTQKVMAYLYKNDIDYYRVSYSNVNFPSSPTDVSASVVDTQVTVSWTGVADANSYNVYRADSQTGTYTKVGVSASSPYTEKVTAMGIYYYEVSAVNVGGFESAYSVPTAVTVTAPGVPTNVSASSADAEITVSWNAVTGASSYNVYRADSQTGIYTKVGASASSPYTETVTAMGIYYYEVSAVSASNFESTYSAPTAVTVTMEIDVTNLPETFSWLSANAIRAGHYTLLLGKDESLPPQMLSYSGTDVTIALKGKGGERIVSLSGNGSLFTVESGVTLVLDDGVTLKGHSNNTTSFSLIWVYSGGNLVLKDGGEISGSVAANGGGVRVNNDGTFTMSGGKISSNSAEGGGGVLIDGGTFIMSGGAISGNTAAVGGGVAVNGGTFTMSGGTISNNTTSYYGGGVYVYSGTFTQSGGTISGNSATYNDGGGVYVSSSGTFTKQSDGIIYGSDTDAGLKNTATSGVGHAVYVSSGNKKRDTTAGVSVTLDSTKDGAAGGWQ